MKGGWIDAAGAMVNSDGRLGPDGGAGSGIEVRATQTRWTRDGMQERRVETVAWSGVVQI